MPEILHRVGINVPARRVFDALTTIDGLRSWWVSNAEGNPARGGVIDFRFCRMRVLESMPDRKVQWQCISGPPEWIDTEVTFDLQWKEEQTFVLFKHARWKEPVEFMSHCSTKWASFLFSLRDFLETGRGRPTPDDLKIHVGD